MEYRYQSPVESVSEPIELELLAIQELAAHPEALQLQLLMMGAMAVKESVESSLGE